jgi:hypothetical protein
VRKIGQYTVGDLITVLQAYDAGLSVAVLTFDEDDQGDGPCFDIRPEMFIYPVGVNKVRYLGIAGYKEKA